jgi:hypothetical protein
MTIDMDRLIRCTRSDAARALAYLDEVATREIVGLSVVRHALESIVKRVDAALEADAQYDREPLNDLPF